MTKTQSMMGLRIWSRTILKKSDAKLVKAIEKHKVKCYTSNSLFFGLRIRPRRFTYNNEGSECSSLLTNMVSVI